MQLKKGTTYRGMMAMLLLAVYLFSPFRIYTPYLSYKINYNYIANVLCENKDKPQLNCKGKCHLSKELKKTAKEESQRKSIQVKSIEMEVIPVPTLIALNPNLIFEKNEFGFYKEELTSRSLKNLTPPPKI